MRTSFAIVTSLCLSFATPAFANPHVDRVIAKLKAEGYSQFEQERTWLGRIRIEAEKGALEREIVINRGTGEVLRDIVTREGFLWFGEDDDSEEDSQEESEEEGEDEEGEGSDGEEDGEDDESGDDEGSDD